MRIQKRRCDRGSGKSELPKQKRNARVFERAKHKTTRCVPYKCENTVSSTIITFLDKTNLRKQTSVHLFMRSNYANCRRKNVPQKLILIYSPEDCFGKRFFIISKTLNITESRNSKKSGEFCEMKNHS